MGELTVEKRFLILSFCCLLASCFGNDDAKSAWNDVIKRCAASSLNGESILFFGPSNAVGAGSVWRTDDQGVYRLRYDLSQMPQPQSFNAPYNESTCDGSTSTIFKAGLTASMEAGLISTDAAADFSNAKTVTGKARAIAWISIAEGRYEEYVKDMSSDNQLAQELKSGKRFVLTRALRVNGFTTTLEFNNEAAAALKAKYPNGPLPSGAIGSVGAGVSSQWTSESTLQIESSGTFFIAGEFQPYKPTGFSGAGLSPFGPKLSIDSTAKARREEP